MRWPEVLSQLTDCGDSQAHETMAAHHLLWPIHTRLPTKLPTPSTCSTKTPKQTLFKNLVSHAASISINFALSTSLALSLFSTGVGYAEAKTGVNKPELLPKEFTTVIDVAGFLSSGQERRLAQAITDLEKDTGFKLRILAQNYPDTPGLAIRDFWQVDDRTIVFVADPTFGNILNFNVGTEVDLDIPRSFWNRLAGKYGNMFYWKEKGEDASVEAAVKAISYCLREPVGSTNCSEVLSKISCNRLQKELAEWQKNHSLGFKLKVYDNLQR